MLELININKIYHNKNSDVKALNNINLKFSNQGMTFIIGSSGCGKTTLLNIIAGNDKDFDGEVLRDGKVETIEQEIQLLENLSILDNLLLATDDKEEVQKFLVQFKLLEPNKKVKKLSGGERKRVQIIRSLLSKATYLICDEPTASLDHDNGEMIMDLLKEVSKNIGVIVVTHDIALVEKYKDRVIQMGKGCIIEDEERLETNKLEKINTEKRTMKQQIMLLFKMMKSRIGEMIFRYILLFFSVLTVFVMMSLFPSLDQAVNAFANWREGRNVIVSTPINTEGSYKATSVSGRNVTRYKFYDIYHKDDLELICDNIDGIIGYRMGWDYGRYQMFAPGNSFNRALNIGGLREVVEKYRQEYIESGKEPFIGYVGMLRTLEAYDIEYPNDSFPKDEYIFWDHSNFIGFDATSYDYSSDSILPQFVCVNYLNNINLEVVPYELFSDVKLDLVYGEMPKNKNEILLSKVVAEKLLKYKKMNSIEELIGLEEKFKFVGKISQNNLGPSIVDTNYTICGITYMNSKLENQIFGLVGTFEDAFIKEYHYQPEIVAYQFMNLLIDPKIDSFTVSTQINKLLDSKDSEFQVFGLFSASKEGYQDPIQIMIFASFALFVLVALYLAMHILMNKRMKKESKILTRYHYPYLNMQIVMMFILFVLVGSMQYWMLPHLCDGLNQLAHSIGMANIVIYDLNQYLFSLSLTVIFVLAIESIIYWYRDKK